MQSLLTNLVIITPSIKTHSLLLLHTASVCVCPVKLNHHMSNTLFMNQTPISQSCTLCWVPNYQELCRALKVVFFFFVFGFFVKYNGQTDESGVMWSILVQSKKKKKINRHNFTHWLVLKSQFSPFTFEKLGAHLKILKGTYYAVIFSHKYKVTIWNANIRSGWNLFFYFLQWFVSVSLFILNFISNLYF